MKIALHGRLFLGFLVCALASAWGCSAILGDFNVLDAALDASNDTSTDGFDTNGDSSGLDAGDASDATDSGLEACPQGSKRCGGACVPITDPTTGCGAASCSPCAITQGTAKCVAGACAVATCNNGFEDCNTTAADGCEIRTANDAKHCGSCPNVCSNMGGTIACNGGRCSTVACNGGFADCNQTPGDGCEIQTDTDLSNCGTCAHVCGNTNAVPSCAGGVCAFACNGTYKNCDNVDMNDCETDTATSTSHCGACNHVCGTAGTDAVACTNGACDFTCKGTFLNCDANDANGCETDGATNASHCGRCGHSCLGGTCSGGKCQPITLASAQAYATGIALDANNVYWANQHAPLAIMKVGKNGAGITALTTGGLTSPSAVATDGINVYWTNFSSSANTDVYQIATNGTNLFKLGNYFGPISIATLNGTVYWGNRYDAKPVIRSPAGSTMNVAMATRTDSGYHEANGIAVDAANVFWTDNKTNAIYKAAIGAASCDVPGGCVAIASGLTSPYALAIDGNNVYWTELGGSSSIKKVSKLGGGITTLATGQPGAAQVIATDGVNVYWANFGDNSIRATSVDNAAACTAATCTVLANAGFFPNGIAVDGQAVFFTYQTSGAGGEGKGLVMKVAKP